jgi:gluconokinase
VSTSVPVIIGLDVGTTAVKAVAFGIGHPFRATALRGYPLLEPVPDWRVQDPFLLLGAVREVLTDVASECRGKGIVGLALSSAMHGLLGIDARRDPLTPVITWADSRASAVLPVLRASGVAEELHQVSGTPTHPMSPALKLRWFAENDEHTRALVRNWLGIKDWMLLALTGVLATDRSTASGTGLMDRWTGEWSQQALFSAQVDSEQLSPILPTTAVLELSSEMAGEVGLPFGLPVVVGATDGPLGNVGAGAIDPGVAGLSLGTSGAMRVIVREQPQVLDPALFCYVLDEGYWAVGGALSNGGVVVPWLATLLTPADQDATRVLALAEQAPAGSEGLVMLPYLLAERAPLWDPEIPGAYLGLRREHGPAHLARAALEGVALQMALIADRLNAVARLDDVRATGGVFRSPLWASALAAAMGRRLSVASSEEGSALGAAVLGLTALGLSPDLGAARRSLTSGHEVDQSVVEPDLDYARLFEAMRQRIPNLVDALAPMRELLR